MIDLHTHSSASDGTYSPTKLINAACDMGLRALALTDHDTTLGINEAAAAAANQPLEFIPGVEISAQILNGSLHIVGLHIDPNHRELMDTLKLLVERRHDRNRRIVSKLNKLGLNLEQQDIDRVAGGPAVGRPHFAQALMEKGHVQSIASAFRKYLGKGRPAYVPKEKLDPARAIEVIRLAGGIPILAHPIQTKRRGKALAELVMTLTDKGLLGIEAYCSGYSHYDEHAIRGIAKTCNLVVSGGSDFHGDIKPEIQLGKGTGNLHVPDHLLGPIRERLPEK